MDHRNGIRLRMNRYTDAKQLGLHESVNQLPALAIGGMVGAGSVSVGGDWEGVKDATQSTLDATQGALGVSLEVSASFAASDPVAPVGTVGNETALSFCSVNVGELHPMALSDSECLLGGESSPKATLFISSLCFVKSISTCEREA